MFALPYGNRLIATAYEVAPGTAFHRNVGVSVFSILLPGATALPGETALGVAGRAADVVGAGVGVAALAAPMPTLVDEVVQALPSHASIVTR